jgi:sensor histidine kinase YesM
MKKERCLMMKKIRNGGNALERLSIKSELVLIVCAILIPMNLMLIIISGRMITTVREQVIDTYQSELSLFITKTDMNILNIDTKLKSLMGENWAGLTAQGKLADFTRFQVWKELQAARENLQNLDGAYLKTNWDNRVVITYSHDAISLTDSERLKDYFADTDMEAYQPYHFAVIYVNGRKYLLDNVNYNEYSFGFIISIDSLLSNLRDIHQSDGDRFYLTDHSGNIVSDTENETVQLNQSVQKLHVGESAENDIIVSVPFSSINYMLVHAIPEKNLESSLSALERGLLFACFLGLLLVPAMIWAVRKLVVQPMNELETGLKEIEQENLDYRMGEKASSREFHHVNHTFNKMVGQIRDLKIETYEKDIEKLKVETTNLRLQINPHLLLNSLNMIYSLAQSRNYEVITKYTSNLMEYFRYSLRAGEELVTVEDEMRFVKNFLDIQKIRFPGAFTHVYEMDDHTDDVLIPPLIIENFVENSIKYALKMGETIEIIIIIKIENDRLTISVLDTGNGIQPDRLETLNNGEQITDRTGTHIGIWNCRRRLKLIYGEEAHMTISSVPGEGTQVWIQLPVRRRSA